MHIKIKLKNKSFAWYGSVQYYLGDLTAWKNMRADKYKFTISAKIGQFNYRFVTKFNSRVFSSKIKIVKKKTKVPNIYTRKILNTNRHISFQITHSLCFNTGALSSKCGFVLLFVIYLAIFYVENNCIIIRVFHWEITKNEIFFHKWQNH